MAISYLRPAGTTPPSRIGLGSPLIGASRRRRRGPAIAGLWLLAVAVALGALAAYLSGSRGRIAADPVALARVDLPAGGGAVEQLAVTGPRANLIPAALRGRRIYPTVRLAAGERVVVHLTIVRPGWLAWLTGRRERLRLALVTPRATPTAHFLTASPGRPLEVAFSQPVSAVAYGQAGNLVRHALRAPARVVALPHHGLAGSLQVAGIVRAWETAQPTTISWFPAGGSAKAVATPAPGSQIGPSTKLLLTFSKPVSAVLGGHYPIVLPARSGHWVTLGTHTIEFVPGGYGYGLGARVTVALPSGVRLVGGRGGTSTVGTWTVPPGSTLRLQQLLSTLGYLPFRVHYAGAPVPRSLGAQEQAALHPPAGSFSWRYGNVPTRLQALWAPGRYGVMTKGAVMMFEHDHGLSVDGIAGPAVWKALIGAVDAGQRSSFGYTFVQVSEGSPETEQTWHDGKIVVSGLVNTGVAAMPTAQGVFPVFLHLRVTTMSGINPNGSHYVDPGIPWVSYFNGGDALHGFIRAGYGYPQSDGCVEMPYSEAAAVYPYTPVGTLVDVY